MLRKVNFYSLCFAFGLSVLLILVGNRYSDGNYLSYKLENGHSNDPQVSVPTISSDGQRVSFGSSNIEKILEDTRFEIRLQLTNYNFTNSGFTKLEDLLFEGGGQPLRSIIVSTWRSGTTFLGEVLNALPGNFYHYEPLLNFKIIQIRGPPHAEKAITNLKNFLNCKFEDMDDYFKYFKTHLHVFSHNTRLWVHCKKYKHLCNDPDFVSRFCRLFPFQSMKIVRIRLRLFEEILDDLELNVKLVLLVRDPRGVIQSRLHRGFCHAGPDCWQPELLCADMISDYVAAGRFLQKYPNRLMVLRYEELALNPNGTSQELFKFFGLNMMPSVQEFLHTHTNNEVTGVSSTFRVSREVPFRWRQSLKFDEIHNIQSACKEAMKLWGYKMIRNSSELLNKDFIPIENYTITQ